MDLRETIIEQGKKAQQAKVQLAVCQTAVKDRALRAMAQALIDRQDEVLAANQADMEAAAVLVGPKIPVILPSRADDPKVKLNAIALCSFLKEN